MAVNNLDENSDIYKFVKHFVLSAEKTKNSSSEVIALLGSACQAIPFAGPFVDKAINIGGKKLQKMSEKKQNFIIETMDDSLPEEVDRKDKCRIIMITAAVEIYQTFKRHLKNISFSCNGVNSRELALQYLAEFAGQRCIQQLVDTGSAKNLHKNLFKSRLSSKVKLPRKDVNLAYHFEDTIAAKSFNLTLSNSAFFLKWIPAYLPDDLPWADLLERKKQKLTTENYVWINKESKNTLGGDCWYYLRPCFSWEIEEVQENNIVELKIPDSYKTPDEIGHSTDHNEDLVNQILKMLVNDKNFDQDLATFSTVKSIGSDVKLLDSKVDGIQSEVEITNTGIEAILTIILKLYDVFAKGRNDVDACVNANNRIKEQKPKLELTNSIDPGNSVFQYSIKSKLGSVLIINNIFNGTHRTRHGAEKDSDRFEIFFKESMGLMVYSLRDVSSLDLPGHIKKFKEEYISNNCCFIIVIIMSVDGYGDNILMCDGTHINFFSVVLDQFNSENFSEFIEKPKLFFLQGCSLIDREYFKRDDSKANRRKIQEYFIGFASEQGCQSYRNPFEGCFYTQALLEAFENFWGTKDVSEIHNFASNAVRYTTNQNCFIGEPQQPWTLNGLRLPFYFVELP